MYTIRHAGLPRATIAQHILITNNIYIYTHTIYTPLGMQAYHGLIQHIRDPTERKAKSDEICAKVSSLRHLLSQKGFEVPVVREKNNMCLGVLPPPPLFAKEIRGKFTGCHVISCYIVFCLVVSY